MPLSSESTDHILSHHLLNEKSINVWIRCWFGLRQFTQTARFQGNWIYFGSEILKSRDFGSLLQRQWVSEWVSSYFSSFIVTWKRLYERNMPWMWLTFFIILGYYIIASTTQEIQANLTTETAAMATTNGQHQRHWLNFNNSDKDQKSLECIVIVCWLNELSIL